MSSMLEVGIDPDDPLQVANHNLQVSQNFMARATHLVRKIRAEATIFHNGRLRIELDLEKGMRTEFPYFDHWEIEVVAVGPVGL